MPLCNFCTSFTPSNATDGKLHLPNYLELQQNAKEGCGGCRSFRDLLGTTLPPDFKPDIDLSAFLELGQHGSSWYGNIGYDSPRSKPRRVQTLPTPDERVQLASYATAEQCLQQVRSWQQECRSHGCPVREQVHLPKRIIEVQADGTPPRLRESQGKIGTYVALTHCWGTKPMKKLLWENEAEWYRGIDPTSLSQNFQDALKITKLLGYRYIWIDALCIVQDSAEDWAEQAPEMAETYSCADLVLSAAFAADSSEGFLQYRPSLVTPRLGPDPSYSVGKAYLISGICEGFNTIENLHKGILDIGSLNSRSWCAQERIMATSILHYTPYGMFWECSKGLQSEVPMPDVSLEDLFRHRTRLGSLDRRKYDILGYVEQWLQRKKSQHFRNWDTDDDTASQAFRAWCHCVHEYSGRNLTHQTDKLPAIAALADVLGGGLGDYLAGLWSRFLQRSLAWKVTGALRNFPTAFRAPSWSWASIDCTVSWDCEKESRPSVSSWSDREGPRLIEHHMVTGLIPNPYMSVGVGSCLVLEGKYVNARSISLPVDNNIHYTGGWDDLTGRSNASREWPSRQDIPEELVLLHLQQTRYSSNRNGSLAETVEIFTILLREVTVDRIPERDVPTFRRLGSGIIYIAPPKGSELYVDALQSSIKWEHRRFTLI
ncbi:heterokaryon incompatibility protein-domain-containing protein [Xylariaceae sp. FL1272]|nr:heterokaryon incompatibility protein-domain-containing protein [Xylariaceae sp. FL1272]